MNPQLALAPQLPHTPLDFVFSAILLATLVFAAGGARRIAQLLAWITFFYVSFAPETPGSISLWILRLMFGLGALLSLAELAWGDEGVGQWWRGHFSPGSGIDEAGGERANRKTSSHDANAL